MKLTSFVFSPCGTTFSLAQTAVAALKADSADFVDLCKSENRRISYEPAFGEVVLFACPMYFGEPPRAYTAALRNIKGSGNTAVVMLNGAGVGDAARALAGLCAAVKAQGFAVVAAESFVSRHAVLSPIEKKHREQTDLNAAQRFGKSAAPKLRAAQPIEAASVPHTAKQFNPSFTVETSPDCDCCGECARECPVNAVNPAFPAEVDSMRCISCARCIKLCPRKAKHFTGAHYAAYAALTALGREQ